MIALCVFVREIIITTIAREDFINTLLQKNKCGINLPIFPANAASLRSTWFLIVISRCITIFYRRSIIS